MWRGLEGEGGHTNVHFNTLQAVLQPDGQIDAEWTNIAYNLMYLLF